MTWKSLGWGMGLVVLVIAVVVFGLQHPTLAQQGQSQATIGPRYTVVDTDATNLIVVDNASNTLYFYTEEPGQEVGQELHMRGSVDLGEVGKPAIRPKPAR